MKNITLLLLSALMLCGALVMSGCGSSEPEIDEPEVEIEADFITVRFEDHSTIELTKGSPEFEVMNDEAIRIYQDISSQLECCAGRDYLQGVIKFVGIRFIEPPSVTTYTDEGEVFKLLDCPEVIFVFTGEFAGFVLCGPTSREREEYGVYESRRSFTKLEKMVDALRS